MRISAIVLLGAALFGVGLAPARADLARGKQAYEKKNYALAFTELSAEAKRGKPEAMYLLGKMYADGEGAARSDAEAFTWFQKGADAGSAAAQGMVAMFYAQGRGVMRDSAKSVEWVRRAADNGDALSQYMMGVRSLDGLGVPKDGEAATTWIGSAAEQNFAVAQYALGVMLGFGPQAKNGSDSAHEFQVEGARWLLLAIRQNSPDTPKAQAKFDELKKIMRPKDVELAQARARAWHATTGKKTGG